jgi:leader peptidase (prepilin peptidase)/N-methyltransferase
LFPEWTVVIGFVFGAVVGSFLNMLIYRLPRGLSFVDPKQSFCPKCRHALHAVDLVPLFSWLSTRGKCRYCKEPVAARYFIVEVITAALFSVIWWQTMVVPNEPQTLRLVFFCLMAAALVAIIFIDWELYIIPDELNAAVLVIGVVYHAINGTIQTAIFGALLGWGLLWGLVLMGRLLFQKDAMGDGDVKMMRGVGALLGPLLLTANLGIAVILGLIGGVTGILLASRQAKAQGAEPIDDGPLPPPTPVGFVLLAGAWYLFCLDVVALFVPPLNRWIESKVPQEVLEEDESWTPSLTTIPFGPYLAAGALVCMLFGGPIENGLRAYWRNATGAGAPMATRMGDAAVRVGVALAEEPIRAYCEEQIGAGDRSGA